MKNQAIDNRGVPESSRPFVLVNIASSADGKIALADREFIAIGSRRDHEHLYELRATADAIICGSRTIASGPVKMDVGGERFRRLRLKSGLKDSPIRVIVSGSGKVNPDAEVFRHRFSPIIILTTQRAKKGALKELEKVADEVRVCGESEVDFAGALKWLRSKWMVKRLLCEGGGELNAAFFRAGLVDEIHLTLCPLVLGGCHSPTLADGRGFERLSDAGQFRIHHSRRTGDEMFLVCRKTAGN